MKKRPDITDATRARIVSAFSDLYRVKPVERITVKAIAAKAGLNRVTFYQYFKDVFDLLDYLENDLIQTAEEEIVSTIHREDMFEGFLSALVTILEKRGSLVELLLTGPNSGRTVSKLKSRAIPLAYREFEIDRENTRANYLLDFYFTGWYSIYGRWLKSGQDLPVEELGMIARHILQNGIMPQL